MFGDDRLEQLLAASAGVDAGALADRIVEAAIDYQGGRTQDDLAVLALRVASEPSADATSGPRAPGTRNKAR